MPGWGNARLVLVPVACVTVPWPCLRPFCYLCHFSRGNLSLALLGVSENVKIFFYDKAVSSELGDKSTPLSYSWSYASLPCGFIALLRADAHVSDEYKIQYCVHK